MQKIKYLIIGVILGILIGFPIFHRTPAKQNTINDYPAIWRDLPRATLLDSWHMGNRECTSWVAWKVFQTFNYKIYEWGDAKDWPESARQRALVVDEIPEVHSAAVRGISAPGHVMWVERINSDGTLHVTQYNADNKGNFSEADVSTSYVKFIHFPKIDRTN